LYSIDYFLYMYTVKTLPEFDKWLNGLKDRITRIRLSRRLDKAQRGNLGDVKPVGEGIFEMREHFGPGWRMYYTKRGEILIVMLGGGEKSSQESDIAKAKQRETALED
jgi:putative addiction module killer protein